MNAQLFTDLTDEQPQVLVVMNDPSLKKWLAQALQNYGLAVVELSETQAKAQIADKTLSPIGWYKIIWWVQDQSQTPNSPIWSWLTQTICPAVIITSLTTPILSDQPAFKHWQEVSHQELVLIDRIQTELPQATLLVGQDVFFSAELFAPFSATTYFLNQQILVDPDITLHPQTAVVFGKTILPNIMSPLPHQLLVQGKKIPTPELVRRAQLAFHRQKNLLPSINTQSVVLEKLPPLPLVQNPEVESIISFIEDLPKMPVITHTQTTITAGGRPLVGRVMTGEMATPHTKPLSVKQPPQEPPPISETPPTPPTQPNLDQPQSNHEIEDQVVELFEKYRSDHKVQRVEKLAGKQQTVTRKVKHRKKLFWGGLAFAATGFVIIVMGVVFLMSTWGLKQAVADTIEHQLTPSIKLSLVGARAADLNQVVKSQMALFGLVLDESFFGQASHLSQLAGALTLVQEEQDAWINQTTQATLQFLGQQEGKTLTSWSQSAATAKSLYDHFSRVQATLKSTSLNLFGTVEQQKEYETQLTQVKKNLLPAQQLQPLFATLLGEERRREYVILFQNNQELRPTGGFIQSVAVISVDQGQIINIQVFSVYDLDTKVLGAVTPPSDLNRYLGEQRWYLRDSNWHPDFPTTSKQVGWFIEKAIGTKPDGVLAVNLISLQELLKEVGPLELPEYNEVITDRNLTERMEFHSEIQLVPNASRPDYPTLVLTRALEKIQKVPAEKVPQLLAVLQKHLENKQILFNLSDPNENASLVTLGWSGSLLKPACPTQLSDVPCLVDVIAQVESNVGVNKANAYVRRTTKHEVEVTDVVYRHHRRTTYTNTATTQAWPKGTYKNYLRFYVSLDAQLESVFIDQKPVPSSQITRQVDTGRQVYGVLVEVPINQEVSIDLNYTVPHSNQGRFSYALFDQRQSGIEDSPTQVTLTHNPKLKPTLIAPQAEVKNSEIIFSTADASHVFVGVQFE